MSRTFLPGTRNVPEKDLLTGKGERKKVRLPDSTLVWLAPCSELKYPEQFEGDQRIVQLSGEAFFEVTSDAQHPFIIHTQSLTTKVLGTAFNIHAYPEDTLITVTLLNGSVVLNDKQHLMPMQKGFFGKNSGTLSYIDDPDAALMLQRREGELEYNNVKLGLIMKDLERLFNVTITIEEDAKDCLFYGRIKANEDIDTFLTKLSRVVGVKVNAKGNRYFIHKGKC
jgi:ferric-dicitrate binding protein FerR (iron transport regulator)